MASRFWSPGRRPFALSSEGLPPKGAVATAAVALNDLSHIPHPTGVF